MQLRPGVIVQGTGIFIHGHPLLSGKQSGEAGNRMTGSFSLRFVVPFLSRMADHRLAHGIGQVLAAVFCRSAAVTFLSEIQKTVSKK